MKVLLVNGSPHQNGCTYTALSEVAGAIEQDGIETEILWVGKDVKCCSDCGVCRGTGRCAFDGDIVNEFIDKAKDADGFVFGSPVYFAAASAQLAAMCNRVFYASGDIFDGKPAAAVASCRRTGISSTLDQIQKYFTIAAMSIIGSQYWNGVHGNTPDEVRQDEEGMQTMRTLGHNMAHYIKTQVAAGIARPVPELDKRTNFIR